MIKSYTSSCNLQPDEHAPSVTSVGRLEKVHLEVNLIESMTQDATCHATE